KPRLTPGGAVNLNGALLKRYDIVQIYAREHFDEYDWYLVGRDQWVEQRNLGVVELQHPPEGVTGKWIAVNLFEQTIAVYEGEQLVYASLVSSGLGAWPTRPGLFHIYSKLDNTNMSGAFAADRSDYYFIEDVPWVLYFDQGISFHGTYWHDGYGFRKSHGCVNLSPRDSRWLYEWAEVDAAVYVYDPSGQTPTTPWTGGGP
ncbi:MAG TPA: L,D-transpeptidase, partial [Anaerolineales bacterium]|nr:L,D-transpeptidase [Anaerolineales bacterium]